MKIVYITLTGQTRKFVNKLDMETIELSPIDPFIEINEPFIIVAPTYEKEATEILWEFLDTGENKRYFQGVAGGGNRNFNELFVFTAKDLARDYDVPLLLAFEFQGSPRDVKALKDKINKIENTLREENKH
ncbi:ribonucleotide reductase stimulatory protein NrdI [Dolosigranulum pigrum]|uniref:ribonucleotide reductase stimulatory protein n=1 Tax=Dolosigranulum pigrum TaxID=29394 RepID=UPI001AD86CAF|nr:class Ib ribonucleoside-diphosphate reductase assembly flavoprotein NrdI [Dolosigranulum pigrum]QTJ38859.1 ribonucleotide reductase stimulatory protein NrdI [Dolosigranulum pigrum]